jgi:hypothetical protein
MRFFENPSFHMLEDLDLMEGVREAYKILVDPNIPICSTGKTYMGISWCLEIAKACRKIIFEASTPPSSEHHHTGSSRKRLSEGLPSSSLPHQSIAKRTKLSLEDGGQVDYSSMPDFPVEKNHSSDLLERNHRSARTSTEEILNLGHRSHSMNRQQQQQQQQQQRHHIFPSGLSSLPHIDSRSSSTEELSLVTDSIPTLSLSTTATPNYPMTQFPPTTTAVGVAAPMMFYTCSEDPLPDPNPISNFLDCDNFLQHEDHDIANQYIPDDISRWLLELAHKEER